MGAGSWPTQTAAKANDRWWEALLAAAATTCYLGVEVFQHSKIESKPLVRHPHPPFHHLMKQYHQTEQCAWVQH